MVQIEYVHGFSIFTRCAVQHIGLSEKLLGDLFQPQGYLMFPKVSKVFWLCLMSHGSDCGSFHHYVEPFRIVENYNSPILYYCATIMKDSSWTVPADLNLLLIYWRQSLKMLYGLFTFGCIAIIYYVSPMII